MRTLSDWRALCRANKAPRGGTLHSVFPFWVRATFEGDVIHVQSWGRYGGPASRPKPWELDRVLAGFKRGEILLPPDTTSAELRRLQAARRIEHPDGRPRWVFPRGGLHPLYAVLAHVLGE